MKDEKKVMRKDPLAGVYLNVKFYCPECKGYFEEYMEQKLLRRLPKVNGKDPRRPDGSILKLCDHHAEKMLQHLIKTGAITEEQLERINQKINE